MLINDGSENDNDGLHGILQDAEEDINACLAAVTDC